MTGETWKAVPGFPAIEASDLGRVRTVTRPMQVYGRDAKSGQVGGNGRKESAGRVLFQEPHNGYHRVGWREASQRTRIYLHRAVALAWLPDARPGDTVDHVDGDRSNNVPANLQWVPRAENTRRQNAAGRGVGRGERHPSSKLKDCDIPVIRQRIEQGDAKLAIARDYGVSDALIYKIAAGRRAG